jgi:hypothetical protein
MPHRDTMAYFQEDSSAKALFPVITCLTCVSRLLDDKRGREGRLGMPSGHSLATSSHISQAIIPPLMGSS